MATEKNVEVKVPGLSGFDKSHRVSGTLHCGTITPLLVDELIPGSKVRLRLNLASQLPPLVSDTYMNVKLKAEAFFVPHRLLCKSFESFFSDVSQRVSAQPTNSTQVVFHDVRGRLPVFVINPTVTNPLLNPDFADTFGVDSLTHHLGFRGFLVDGQNVLSISAMPFLAYHLIWQEWYRNPRVQNPAFAPVFSAESVPTSEYYNRIPVSGIPYMFLMDETIGTSGNSYYPNYRWVTPTFVADGSVSWPVRFMLADGTNIFSLRQRNFPLDMYTSAMVSPQQGEAAKVSIQDLSDSPNFTIAALRTMNSIQQFRDRNNIPSSRMIDQVYARYGVRMSDGVAQRPICIGTAEYDVYSKGVDQTAVTEAAGSNPFNSVGSQYGRAYASGSDFIIDNFEAKEPGYLFVNVTLVPYVSYGDGISPLLRRYISDGSITDMANPILQNVGPEPVYVNELSSALFDDTNPSIFAYRERYGFWKDMRNRVFGRLVDGETLESFVLQRSVSGRSTLGSAFLEIPRNYMDQVFSATDSASGFACWLDSRLDYHVVMPLSKYSLPTLQDPAYEHGHSISLRKNGQVF